MGSRRRRESDRGRREVVGERKSERLRKVGEERKKTR